MWRLKSAFLVLLLAVFAIPSGFAQLGGTPTVAVIQVRVMFANDRPVGQQIEVELLNEQSIPLGQTFTDNEGRAEFQVGSNAGGVYRVRASGTNIETGLSDLISLAPRDRMAMAWVHVQEKSGSGTPAKTSTAPVTTANELRIPADAKKAFLKGMDALYRHDFPTAIESFEKAVATYPQYDAAYDNLAVTYMQLGQTEKARAAFERAVQLNDKNADAERNFARLLIGSKEYARAIELLNKALTVEPSNAGSLTLLSIAQLRSGDVDAALQNALKVHQLPHDGFAVAAYYVAGRAYESKQQYQKATVEYEAYLNESPNGPEAAQVRSALARVTASAGTPPASSAPQ